MIVQSPDKAKPGDLVRKSELVNPVLLTQKQATLFRQWIGGGISGGQLYQCGKCVYVIGVAEHAECVYFHPSRRFDV